MGSSTENSAFGVTRNPQDLAFGRFLRRGGGGVAADECLGAGFGHGRLCPAARVALRCVGLKPTYGRVSRYGLVAFASSLDQIGPLAKTVADAALLLRAISGHDHRVRPASHKRFLTMQRVSRETSRHQTRLAQGVYGRRVGRGSQSRDPSSCRTVQARAEVIEVSLPHTDYAMRPTTSLPPPKPAPTSRALMASATGFGWRKRSDRAYGRTGRGRRGETANHPGTYVLSSGTTTRIICGRRKCGR